MTKVVLINENGRKVFEVTNIDMYNVKETLYLQLNATNYLIEEASREALIKAIDATIMCGHPLILKDAFVGYAPITFEEYVMDVKQ